MIRVLQDTDTTGLRPEGETRDLALCLHLLAGRRRDELSQSSIDRDKNILDHHLASSRFSRNRITWEQLNELLLLIEEDRVTSAFYRFVILDDPTGRESGVGTKLDQRRGTFLMRELPSAAKRLRGLAMLVFGNFRFGFETLSNCKDLESITRALGSWGRDSSRIEAEFKARPDAIASMTGTMIPDSDTWLLGYLSSSMILIDIALSYCIRASSIGGGLEEVLKEELVARIPRLRRQIENWFWPPRKELVDEFGPDSDSLAQEARDTYSQMVTCQELGKSNTTKYLTWDFIDVYVATSMRHPWEFEETARFVRSVFSELKDLNLRWFDPTQSFEPSVVNKSLIEALMLKRAQATIYMVQETDTLGKDSELAATLAQGKPVIAYLRSLNSAKELREFASRLRSDYPPAFFRNRIHSLKSQGYFENPENIRDILTKSAILGVDVDEGMIRSGLDQLLRAATEFERSQVFKVLRLEYAKFRKKVGIANEHPWAIMAATEAAFLDKRASELKEYHPLALQVNLENGVANGVIVVRTAKECSAVLRSLVTNQPQFNIRAAYDDVSSDRIVTELMENITNSRFRVVTSNSILTNSFWNFYLRREGSYATRGREV